MTNGNSWNKIHIIYTDYFLKKESCYVMEIEIARKKLKRLIEQGEFGLEKENLRIDSNGNLSTTPHPFLKDEGIERDFCESQTEMITGVWNTVEQVWKDLYNLHTLAEARLLEGCNGEEYLWPFSNPPYVESEDDIKVANYQGELAERKRYREYLARKYGKRKMLFCGVHFNFSFTEEMLQELFLESGEETFQNYKNELYLDLAQKLVKFSWLIVYLTAASPMLAGTAAESEEQKLQAYASPRCSEIGYWNTFVPVFSYHSLADYVSSIEQYVAQGQLFDARELYYPIRLKPRGEYSLEKLRKQGINHIELRMLDLNPLSPVGVKQEDLFFLHLLIIYLLFHEKTLLSDEEQRLAVGNMKKAAAYDDTDLMLAMIPEGLVPIRQEAIRILRDMKRFYKGTGEKISRILDYQMNKICNPKSRYAVQIFEKYQQDFVNQGLFLARIYARKNREEENFHVRTVWHLWKKRISNQ